MSTSRPGLLAGAPKKGREKGNMQRRNQPIKLRCLVSPAIQWAGTRRVAHRHDGNVPSRAPRRQSGGRRWAGRIVAAAVVVVALGGLLVGAFHGARQSSSIATAADARSWETDATYWACLDAQAHSLVAPGEHIWYDTHNLANWVTLEKVFAPWTVGVSERSQARVWVSLRPARGRDQCLGTVVVGARP